MTTLEPDSSKGWCEASALLLLAGRTADAYRAALKARWADRIGHEPLMALASSLYRLGQTAQADSTFRMALARMPAELRNKCDDSSVLQGADAMEDSAVARGEGEQLWERADPDLTTPENEALLDYWTRLTLVNHLFSDGGAVPYSDARVDLFLRYGPPDAIIYNPSWPGDNFSNEVMYVHGRVAKRPRDAVHLPIPNLYPYNTQVWKYTKLGMSVGVHDLRLTNMYEYTPSTYRDRYVPSPSPDSAAAHPEYQIAGVGFSSFRAIAPGLRPMPISGLVSKFVVEDSTSVLASVAAAGSTVDSMVGGWAVVGEDGVVRRRESQLLRVSACDPGSERVGRFTSTLPPGPYRVDLAVSARGGRRGLTRQTLEVAPPRDGLQMSDLVLVCGDPVTATTGGVVRIEANPSRLLASGQTMTAYCELDGLLPAETGEARFSLHYSIRALIGAERGPVLLESSRDEVAVGSHRRQFVTAGIGSLRPGRYELRVDVRDQVGDESVWGATEFIKPHK